MHNLGPVYLITKTCSLLIKIPTILIATLLNNVIRKLVKLANRTVIINLPLHLRANPTTALITVISKIKTLLPIRVPTNKDTKVILILVLNSITLIAAALV